MVTVKEYGFKVLSRPPVHLTLIAPIIRSQNETEHLRGKNYSDRYELNDIVKAWS